MTNRDLVKQLASLSPKRLAVLCAALQSELDSVRQASTEPIAIVGMACRFPGGSEDPESFWQLLRAGVDATREVPPDRWDIDAYYHPEPATPGKMYTRRGAFLDRVDWFDAAFFGISPREAVSMDPQQRLLLEVAWEALEHAGWPPERLTGSRTGVFVGIGIDDYAKRLIKAGVPERIDAYAGTGNGFCFAAGRLSYVLGLEGPSLSLDTACSTSLVTVHLACQSLRTRDCDLALAGGVNLMLSPEPSLFLSSAKALAADGRCKTFDAAADGYARSEGCGLVVVKRLSDAVRDSDDILALIRGSAVNHCGDGSGLTVPSVKAQTAVIRDALAAAGVEPGDVAYVEAHGTGTALGDPIEMRALEAVMRKHRAADNPLLIGSVKTNFGHLEVAAGIASLIKVVLALQHEEIPPHLNLRQVNPHINLVDVPARIPITRTPWPRGAVVRRAGVSSFGLSGTNSHVIVEEAQASVPAPDEEPVAYGAVLLPLSARTPEALKAVADDYRRFAQGAPATPLRDLCYSASVRRSHHDIRLAVVARSIDELTESLAAFVQSGPATRMRSGRRRRDVRPRVAFVFSGQGHQSWAMGRQLLAQEPVFRGALERCDERFRPLAGWSLVEELTAGESDSRLRETQFAQPVVFAVQVALAALWRAWGIGPDAVVGHSMGEVAAAHVAGSIGLDEALSLIYHRGRLMEGARGSGRMAVVGLSLDAAKELARARGLFVAAINSPSSTVLAGDATALEDLRQSLGQRDVLCRLIPGDYPFHTPQMQSMAADLVRAVGELHPEPGAVPIFSSVTGRRLDASSLGATYWAENFFQPVWFAKAVTALLDTGHTLFLEIGPHPVLATAIVECLQQSKQQGQVLASMRQGRDDRETMLDSLGALYVAGCPVDWNALFPSGKLVRLPPYPWQRQRYWLDESKRDDAGSARPHTRDNEFHPLLGRRLRSPVIEDDVFQAIIDTGALPFLRDHRIAGSVLLPATAYLEMALAASVRLAAGLDGVRDLFIREPLAFSGEEPRTIQTVVRREGGETRFKCFARQPADEGWTLHATGTLTAAGLDENERAGDAATLEQIRRRCDEELSATEYYEALHARGLQFGPAFRGIRRIWRGSVEALAEIGLSADGASAEAFRIHPALLDACFHVVAAALPPGASERGHDQCYVPVSCRRFHLQRSPGTEIWCQARIGRVESAAADSVLADLRLFDATGALLADIEGLLFRRADPREASAWDEGRLGDSLHALHWVPKARETPARAPSEQGRWLLFCDREGVGEAVGERLRAGGHQCAIVRAGRRFDGSEPGSWRVDPANQQDFHRLVQEAVLDSGLPFTGAIHLWSLDISEAHEDSGVAADADLVLGCGSVLHLVQALAGVGWSASPRLWLVTRAAQPVSGDGARVSLGQAGLWGLARSVALEHPELACVRVDLDETVDEGAVSALVDEIRSGDGEDQVAFRGGTRHVLRLVPMPSPRAAQTSADRRSARPRRAPVRLEIPAPGTLDHLVIRDVERTAPGPGQVEIEVRASGLNFKDVLNALGMYPGPAEALGDECAGTIVALGTGVDRLRVGDDVVAVAEGTFGTFVTTDARLVARKPVGLGFEQAAGIPIAFLTATYALQGLANISAGERVLIHAAAGGVGMAALQVARRSGAEVFATAGSPKKREFLRSLGVQHVMDSRSLDFAGEIMAQTGGEGIDVVLNCLSGEATRRSVLLLRTGGRFLELGKNGILSPAQVSQLKHDIDYFVVALDRLCAEKPSDVSGLLATILAALEEGSLTALPSERFTLSDAGSAFRHMAQARHIGKVVLMHEEPVGGIRLRDGATYLITGGLGAIGLHLARWMVKEGARHLVLLGRSEPSQAARKTIAHLQEASAQVKVVSADVCRADALAGALEDVRRSMPPLRGVLHAASILDDGVLVQQSWDRLSRVMAPAVAGAWNLHTLTRNSPLDFFVLFSSAASILGSPGQGNYAAAGAFLDALAHHRRALGLPATTINWGPWSGVGMTAGLGRRGQQRWAAFGMERMTAAQALRALAHVLSLNPVQMAVLPIAWSKLGEQFSDGGVPPLLSLVLRDARAGAIASGHPAKHEGLLLQWRDVHPRDRRDLLMSHLANEAIRILALPPSHHLDPQESLLEMGMDSLMAVEFRNRLLASLGRALPSTLVFDYPTIESLAGYLLQVVPPPAGDDLGDADGAQDGESADLDALLTKLEQVSEEEARAILSQRMARGL